MAARSPGIGRVGLIAVGTVLLPVLGRERESVCVCVCVYIHTCRSSLCIDKYQLINLPTPPNTTRTQKMQLVELVVKGWILLRSRKKLCPGEMWLTEKGNHRRGRPPWEIFWQQIGLRRISDRPWNPYFLYLSQHQVGVHKQKSRFIINTGSQICYPLDNLLYR